MNSRGGRPGRGGLDSQSRLGRRIMNLSLSSPTIPLIDPSSSRREFLSGRSVLKQVERAGGQIADGLAAHPPEAGDTIRLEARAMACPWCIVLNPVLPPVVMAASHALDLVHELERQLTVYREESEVSRLNREAAEAPQVVERRLFELLGRAKRLSAETGGAFDPTSGELILLWRRSREEGRIPTQEEVDSALERTGIERLVEFHEEESSIRFHKPGVKFDLGAIGKGYAIDRIAEELRDARIADFLVHGGFSSLFAQGDHNGQGGWPVGIRNPLFTEQRYATVLLRDQGMATSGSNIQYFRHEGQRYGHILDPRTGWPADKLLSVTVLAPTAEEADAVSTAFYALGLEKAREYCDTRRSLGALLIPAPAGGRTLEPVVCNIPDDALFFGSGVIDESAW
jgi:thiamine biosynthesis lipoprotein